MVPVFSNVYSRLYFCFLALTVEHSRSPLKIGKGFLKKFQGKKWVSMGRTFGLRTLSCVGCLRADTRGFQFTASGFLFIPYELLLPPFEFSSVMIMVQVNKVDVNKIKVLKV